MKPFHNLNYWTHLIQIEFCVIDAFRLDSNLSAKLCILCAGNILRERERAINNRFRKSSSTDLTMASDNTRIIIFPHFLFFFWGANPINDNDNLHRCFDTFRQRAQMDMNSTIISHQQKQKNKKICCSYC